MPSRCGECGCKRRGKNHNEGKQHINRVKSYATKAAKAKKK